MAESTHCASLWKRGNSGDLNVSTVRAALESAFAKCKRFGDKEQAMSITDESSDRVDDDASMRSAALPLPKGDRECVSFSDDDSMETMSITDNIQKIHIRDSSAATVRDGNWRRVEWPSETTVKDSAKREPSYSTRCLKCEAYDSHCKSAAENYRRTLGSYTRTVSELMLGFKTVLEKYPELKVDSSDERIHYMVQAALGRNNLVREMVHLAAKRNLGKEESDSVAPTAMRSGDRDVVAVHEALNVCYNDGEALRMILDRYADLYVRYIQVWRDMVTKVSKDVTVLEFVHLTQDRPGVAHGEPWSEARAYVSRMVPKVTRLMPGSLGLHCVKMLENVDYKLTCIDNPTRKEDLEYDIASIRDRLDGDSKLWGWDSHMTDLYLEIRSDLTILETLIGVGRLSIKTLLHERFILVSQLRGIVRTKGSLELTLAKTTSKLRDSERRAQQPRLDNIWF